MIEVPLQWVDHVRPQGDPHDPYFDVEPIPHWPADLPDLEPDEFGWTPAELAAAAQTARDWLFDPLFLASKANAYDELDSE